MQQLLFSNYFRYKINQHQSIEERFAAAKMLKNDPHFEFDLVVDTMQDEANFAYGAIPERMAIVYNSQVKYIGGIGPYYFDFDEMKGYALKIIRESN